MIKLHQIIKMNLITLRFLEKNNTLLCIVFVWILSFWFCGFALANKVKEDSLSTHKSQITDVRAFLYYHDKGSFSAQDLLSGSMWLWNVVIGGGGSEAPSSTMLVLVSVQNVDVDNTTVKLTVKDDTIVLSNQTISLRSFFVRSLSPTFNVPFIIYETACERLKIIATLETKGKQLSKVSKIAPFKCGE